MDREKLRIDNGVRLYLAPSRPQSAHQSLALAISSCLISLIFLSYLAHNAHSVFLEQSKMPSLPVKDIYTYMYI